MGMTSDMKHMFHFTYRAKLDQGLIEHEIDHVFFGQTNQTPKVNAAEVQDWKYISLIDLEIDLQKNPDHYTAWFKIIFDRVKKSIATYIA